MSTTKGRGDINTTGDDIVLKSGETDQVTISAGDNASAATHTTPDNSSVLVGAEHGGDATKKVAFDSSGATTSTKSTIAASQTTDRTITLPDASDTLVGRATTDTLTNKTIDGDNNTISNLAHGAEVDNPTSGVHGATGSIVGTSDAQTLTNKTIDADNNTISNLAHGAEVDNPSSGVHGVSGSVVGTTDTQTLTNKTLQDSTTSIADNADATKAFKFEVSGITTATTRTATVPDADFTMVGTATSQTLTNKTIDGDNNTISNLAHGAEVDNPSSGVHGVTGSVVGTTDTQDLSGKTFTDALTLEEQASTPSNPPSGDKKLYPKTDGKLYTLDSSGNEIQVGSGVGGGSLNLNLNPDAEVAVDNSGTNDVGDYIDSGAGTTASKTTTSSEIPLYPFKLSAVKITLATGTNDYTRLRFQVPAGYRNRILGIRWSQIASGLSSQNIKVELYRYSDAYVTGEEEVALSTDDSSGDTYTSLGDAFLSSFSPNSYEYYEFRWINNGGTSGYLSMNEISFDAGDVSIGPADTEWKTYTPTFTGLGTVTVNDFVYRVRGQNAEVSGQVVTGTVTATEIQMTLPMSGTVDYSQNSFSVAQPVGIAEQNASNALRKLTVLATDGDTYVNFSKQVDGSSSNPLVPDLGSNALASTTRFAIKFSVPLVELRNNYSLTATEAVSQNARVRYYLGAAQSPTANTAFNLSTESTLLAKKTSWSNSSGEITVPSPGDYKIQMSASFSSIAAAAEAYIAIGGTRSIDIDSIPSAALGTRGGADITITDPATETISIRADQNITTLTTGDQNTWISITRISDRSGSTAGFPILGDITTGTTESGVAVKQSATADIGAAPSQTDFNNLLQKLRDAGILAT